MILRRTVIHSPVSLKPTLQNTVENLPNPWQAPYVTGGMEVQDADVGRIWSCRPPTTRTHNTIVLDQFEGPLPAQPRPEVVVDANRSDRNQRVRL